MPVYVSVNDPVIAENAGFIDFVVTLSEASLTSVTVPYSTNGVSAGNGSDYTFQNGNLVFAPGVLSQTVRVVLLNDSVVEHLEMIKLSLGSPNNAVLVRPDGTAVIIDNDTLASPGQPGALSVRDMTIDESAGTVSFVVLLDKATSDSFSVSFSTVDGNAGAGADYTAASGTLTFAAGETVKTVVVAINNDSLSELEEMFHLNLGALSGNAAASVQLADASAQATIGRNDQSPRATPLVSVANTAVTENAGYLDFVVSLSAPSTNQISVNYSTNNQLAGNGSDYVFDNGTLVFAPGVTTQTVRIALLNDTTVEETETFLLSLSNPVNAALSVASGSATLVDNDTLADPARPASLVVRSVNVDEGAGTATFVVTLDKATSSSFNVAYSTGDGSALQGADYLAAQGQLTFGAGETVKSVTVALFDDNVAELEETFVLNLGTISGAGAAQVQVGVGTGQALIARSDQTAVGSPVITASDPTVSEGDGYVDFVVSLSAPGIAQVRVSYSTENGQAGNGSDFLFTNGVLLFEPGVTSQSVRVPIINNSAAEALEGFRLNLSNPINAVIAKAEGDALIADNDTPADPSTVANLSVRDLVVDELAGTVTFTVLLDKAASDSFSVAYFSANGSARSGSDFTGVAGSLQFAPGQTARTVTVAIASDTLAENAEFFFLNLGVVSGKAANMVQVADGVGKALIGRSDQTGVGTPYLSVADQVVGEGKGYVDVLISLSAPALAEVRVSYATDNGIAGNGSDYIFTSGQLVFAPGVTTQSVRIGLIDSTAAEPGESFSVRLSNASNAIISKDEASITIADNDTLGDSAAPGSLAVRDVVVDELAGTATFDVVLSRANSDSFSVAYRTVDGSAVAGADYSAAQGKLSFAAGETVQSVTVNLIGDAAAEQDELFGLQLGALSGRGAATVDISDNTGLATISRHGLAAAAAPVLSITPVTVGEIDVYAEFVVTLSAPSTSAVSVSYSTSNASAGNGSDYLFTSGRLNFAPGVMAQTVRVNLINDTVAEAPETFMLNLSNPLNATLSTTAASAGATIVDNDTLADSAAPASLSVESVVVSEKDGSATFALTLSKATVAGFNVSYNSANGTAAAGLDYFATSGIIGFAPGETVKHVTVALVADPYLEGNETFNLLLGAPSGAGAGVVTLTAASATATIADSGNLGAPVLALTASTGAVTEGHSVTFSLANTALSAGIGLPYNLAGVTADRVAQPLQGAFTVDSLGNASVRFDFIDNDAADGSAALSLTTPGASASITLGDAAVRSGTAGPDGLTSTAANDKIDGGAGVDTVTYAAPSANFDISRTSAGYLVNDVSGANGRDLLVNVERLAFSDRAIALDIDGNGGQVYRIYQAAFDRQPDKAGVGFWMAQMDAGLSLETVAGGFVASAEFAQVFGANPSAEAFVGKVYSNVLHRAPDPAGFAFWVNAVNSGVSKAVVLAAVSESPENQAQVIGTIENGFEYLPYP